MYVNAKMILVETISGICGGEKQWRGRIQYDIFDRW
jgi:hypothetical protein